MRLVFLAPMLIALTSPAVAASRGQDVVVDGATSYTAVRNANGVVRVVGHAGPDSFELHIRGNRVEGMMGASSVAFTVSPETVARLNAEMPAGAVAERHAGETALAAN